MEAAIVLPGRSLLWEVQSGSFCRHSGLHPVRSVRHCGASWVTSRCVAKPHHSPHSIAQQNSHTHTYTLTDSLALTHTHIHGGEGQLDPGYLSHNTDAEGGDRMYMYRYFTLPSLAHTILPFPPLLHELYFFSMGK